MIMNFRNVGRTSGNELNIWLIKNGYTPHVIDNDTNTVDLIVKSKFIEIKTSEYGVIIKSPLARHDDFCMYLNDVERIEIL